MVMTPEEYAEKGGVLCPACKLGDIEGRQVDISADHAFQQCTCNACHAEWTDEYKLTGYSNLTQEEAVVAAQEYTEEGGVLCLSCGSGDVKVTLDVVYKKYWCGACGTEWADRLASHGDPEQEETQ